MSRPTEVWVRCPANNCGDDVRMEWVEGLARHTYWAPESPRNRGCNHHYNPRQEDELAALAEADAQRIEREGDAQ